MTKSVRSDYGMNQFIRTGLASVLLVMFFTVVAVPQAAAVAISSCGDCHGYPPVDTISRGTPTGAVVGNHAKHATSYSYPCALCHPSAGYTYSHQTGTINMNSSFTSTAVSGSYSRGTGILQTNDLTGANLGICAGTYCHSNGTGNTLNPGDPRSIISKNSPSWGTTAGCGGCHGSDSTGRPTGSDKANSHQNVTKHQSLTCEKCHYPTTTTGDTITDTAKHVNRFYDVVGTGGTYSFNYTYASDGGTCSTSYCHGTGPVKWSNTTGTLNCSSCHTSMGAGGTAAYTGKHQKHVNTAGYDFSCEMCHSIQNNTVHVNGEVVSGTQSAELKFRNDNTTTWQTGQAYNSSPSTYKYRTLASNPYLSEAAVTPGYTSSGAVQTDGTLKWRDAGSCSTVWCHSNANPRTRTAGEAAGSLNAYKTVAFNDTNSCALCHLGPASYATMTGATDRLSTNHAEHLATDRYGLNTTNYTCNTCHKDTADNNNTLNATTGYTNHVNASKNVVFNTAFWGGGTWSAPNCSTNVYCHSTGDRLGGLGTTYRTLSWADSAITTCTPCHRGPESTVSTMKTGADRMSDAHAKHLATTDGHGTNTNFTCNTCHNDTASNNTTISSYTLHVNKTKDVALNTWAAGTWNGSPNYTCSSTYCHSIGIGGTTNSGETRTIQANTSIAWTATSSCTSCHASPPNYPNNDASYQSKRNSHAAGSHAAMTCDKCHVNTTSTGAAITTPANHVNKLYNVNQGTGITFTYTYDVGGGSCSSITGPGGCHGTAQWGVTVINCITCHNSAADAGDGGPTRRAVTGEFGMAWSHKRSAGGTVTANDCGVCHMEGNTSDGTVNATYHKNNAIDLRDPDLGTAIASFATFTPRNTASATLEAWVTNVQNNFCLKCHDSGGATAASAIVTGGTPTRPFGVAVMNSFNQNVLDVNSQFATTNATFHPVRGAQNNPFASVNTMLAPWNTKAAPAAHPNQAVTNGSVMSCWDCHESLNTAHGGSVTLRTGTSLDYNASLGSVTAVGDTLCLTCHNGPGIYTSTTANGQSAFGGVNWGTTYPPPGDTSAGHMGRMTNANTGACTACHGSSWLNPGRPFKSDDFHGNNNNAYYKPDLGITPTLTVAGTNWTNATSANLGTSNNAYATYNGTTQDNLSVTGFGYTATLIPTTVTITGIAVIVEGNGASATEVQRQIRLNLSKTAGTAAGAWKTGVRMPQTTDTTIVFGGPTDLWGTTWTPAQIVATGFGVLLSDNDTTAGGNISIDQIRVVVYTNRWGDTTATNVTGAKPYSFLRNAAEKNATVTTAQWRSWRPRKDGATDNTSLGWGCSWNIAASGAPCSRTASHLTTWISYGPGGVY